MTSRSPRKVKRSYNKPAADFEAEVSAGMQEVAAEVQHHQETLQALGNRAYEACFLAQGERALIMRALKHFVSDQHQMITSAYKRYMPSGRALFEDHKAHHQKQIAAADALMQRFQRGGIKSIPVTFDKEQSK